MFLGSPVNLGSCVPDVMNESTFSFVLFLHRYVLPWGIGWDVLKGRESYPAEPHNHFSLLGSGSGTPLRGGTMNSAFFYEETYRELWAKFKKWSVLNRYPCYVKQKTTQDAKQYIWYNMHEKMKGYVYEALNYVYLYIWHLHIHRRCLRIHNNPINILRKGSGVCERRLSPFPLGTSVLLDFKKQTYIFSPNKLCDEQKKLWHPLGSHSLCFLQITAKKG